VPVVPGCQGSREGKDALIVAERRFSAMLKSEKKKDVRGKVFLVTGGAMGMGRLTAELFARDGARVVLWDLNEKELEKTTREMKDRGWEVYSYVVDVTDRAKVYETAEKVKREVGIVDIVMNNAGIIKGGAFVDVPDEDHFRTMDVNFNAYMWVTKAFLPDMMRRNEGHFINVASAAGLTYVPLMANYCASKAAVVNFTDSLRLEMKRKGYKGIKFTCICPSYVKTGMFEGVKAPIVTPWLEPEDMANRIYEGFHKDKRFVRAPFMVKLVPFLRAITPGPVYDVASTILGISRSMETWTGRRSQ